MFKLTNFILFSLSLSLLLSLLLLLLLLLLFYYQSLYRNSIKAKLLWDKLSLFPQCSHLALPLWVVYNSDTPPVWVDADVSYMKLLGRQIIIFIYKYYIYFMPKSNIHIIFIIGKVTVSNKGKVSSSDCLNNLASALSIKTFQHSSHKAAKAKNCLFW